MNCTPKQQEMLDLPMVKELFQRFDLVLIDKDGNPGQTQEAKVNKAISSKVQNWQNAFKASTSNDLPSQVNSTSAKGDLIQPTHLKS